ncbi:unnamed protein product [Bemisia tabaci]|uniref:BZIP domain-containing protein n=1 Tax=Bemisia tabaci TaxID=7038 RepID=A0A9P0F6T5_BEMTA|nr:unnamed protein product [Bemisia tabaci]
MSRQDRNKGSVTALVLDNKQFTSDETPTPTRLIRDCETLGLFDDLQKVNLFEESFRKRVELGPNHQPSSKVSCSNGDDLLTPTIFTASADSASDISMSTVEVEDPILAEETIPEEECHSGGKFGIKETSMTDSDMSDVSSTRTISSNVREGGVIIMENFSGALRPLEEAKLKLKSTLMSKKNLLQSTKSKSIFEDKEKSQSRNSAHSSSDEVDKETMLKRERNRVAAMRSRKKRKTWVEQLEKSAGSMQMINTKLQTEVTCLRAEVAQLKTLLLAHKDCPVTKAMVQDSEAPKSTSPPNLLEQLIPDHFLSQLSQEVSDKEKVNSSKLRVLLQQKLSSNKPVDIAPAPPTSTPVSAISSTTSVPQFSSGTLTPVGAAQSIVVVVKSPNTQEPVKKIALSSCDLDQFIPVIKCNPNAIAVQSEKAGCESYLKKKTKVSS